MDRYRRYVRTRIMRALGYIGGLALMLLCAASAENIKTPDVYLRVFPYGEALNYQRIKSVSAEERKILVEFLSEVIVYLKKNGQKDLASYSTTRELALLGEDWARDTLVSDFLLDPKCGAGKLGFLRDAKIISMIGEDLFRTERQIEDGDVGFAAPQEVVAGTIVVTLAKSSDFTEEVNNWARRVRSDGWKLQILRPWYRANEAKLKAWDFKAVQPGVEPTGLKHLDLPDVEDRSPLRQVAPPVTVSVTVPAQDLGNAMSPAHTGSGYLWTAALLLAICGGLLWLFRRKRS